MSCPPSPYPTQELVTPHERWCKSKRNVMMMPAAPEFSSGDTTPQGKPRVTLKAHQSLSPCTFTSLPRYQPSKLLSLFSVTSLYMERRLAGNTHMQSSKSRKTRKRRNICRSQPTEPMGRPPPLGVYVGLLVMQAML